jgi:integrase
MTAARAKRSRIYWRNGRAWGDFRDYADAGGGREALVAPGERRATTNEKIAQQLAAERIRELEGAREGRILRGSRRRAGLAEFAREHLIAKAKAGRVTDDWLAYAEHRLKRAIHFLGAGRPLEGVAPSDVRRWVEHLRGEGLSGGTVRHHLNALSNLYRFAQSENCVVPGFNPVAAMIDKPAAKRREARWLEIDQAAQLLETARTYKPVRSTDRRVLPFTYPLLATFLLTGGRRAEVLGLEVEDLSFDRKTVTFRPNAWRRLKTGTSARVVPLWPQLEGILRPYVFDLERPPGRLLFPGRAPGGEAMVVDIRKQLDGVGQAAGWKRGEITSRMFRHTYCAARLQTLDRGAPVSEFTVGRELGHGGHSMVRRVYGHLGQVRHRSEVVEYFLTQTLAQQEGSIV